MSRRDNRDADRSDNAATAPNDGCEPTPNDGCEPTPNDGDSTDRRNVGSVHRRKLLAACSAAATGGIAGCGGFDDAAPTAGETTPPAGNGDAASTDGDGTAPDDRRAWPMFLFDRRNRRCFTDGTVSDPAREEPTLEWSYGTDDAIWSSPVVADGTLYVGCYDRHLYAIAIDSGKLLWRYRTGDRIDGSPAVAAGTVYVGSFDRNVYALDADTGEEVWIRGTRGIVRSSPTVHDGVVYIGAFCRTEECSAYYDVAWPERGCMLALDADTGALSWRYDTDDGVITKPVVADGTAWFGSSDETLYAVDADTGERRWSRAVDGDVMSSPTLVDDRLYVGTTAGRLYAVDAADGRIAWRYDAATDRPDDRNVAAVVSGTPAVCDGTVHVGTVTNDRDGSVYGDTGGSVYGELHAVSTDGDLEWIEGPFGEAIGSSVAVVNGILYFGAHSFDGDSPADRGVYAVNADGAERWSHVVDGPGHRGFGSSPAIVDATLYIGSTDGHVHAFDLGD